MNAIYEIVAWRAAWVVASLSAGWFVSDCRRSMPRFAFRSADRRPVEQPDAPFHIPMIRSPFDVPSQRH